MRVLLVLLLVALIQCIRAEWEYFPNHDDQAVAELQGLFAEIESSVEETSDAAEEVAEEVADEVEETAEEEDETEADKKFCGNSCTGGKKSVANGVKPSYNGCGPNGTSWVSKIFSKALNGIVPQSFRSCCNAHDLGYGTCGSNRDAVDKAFYSCMTAAVNNMKKKKVQSAAEKRCISLKLDWVFYKGVNVGGCGPFTTSQKKHCTCK